MKHAPSINPEEIEKFSKMAEDWWNPEGKFKPLHKFNPIRLFYIKEILSSRFKLDKNLARPLQGIKILDVGCGGGLLSAPLCRLGAEVTAIDASEKNIKIATAYALNENLDINFLHASVEDLVNQNIKYDLVLNMEVIEHVANVESFLKDCGNLVKDNGLMLVATINRNIKSYAMAIIGAEYVLRWLPKGTHEWKKFLKPHEINQFLEENNFKLLESKGVKYNPVRDEFFISEDLSVNYMMLFEKTFI
jgi:2-polyprenyl-6-hydroxyphenyl methylase/3-demethylubiquinone-9 3-methyltransferase